MQVISKNIKRCTSHVTGSYVLEFGDCSLASMAAQLQEASSAAVADHSSYTVHKMHAWGMNGSGPFIHRITHSKASILFTCTRIPVLTIVLLIDSSVLTR